MPNEYHIGDPDWPSRGQPSPPGCIPGIYNQDLLSSVDINLFTDNNNSRASGSFGLARADSHPSAIDYCIKLDHMVLCSEFNWTLC